MYKVFFNDKPVLLSDDFEELKNLSGYLLVRFDSEEEILPTIDILESTDVIKGLVFYHEDMNHIWNSFRSVFKWIEAAGGLVENAAGEQLWIHRNGKWDLPKGKLENGESPADGALREVEEECGVSDLELGAHLVDTYHIYQMDEKWMLKKTHWYTMSSQAESLVAQTEEGITEVAWKTVKGPDLDQIDTYSNIKLVIESRGH